MPQNSQKGRILSNFTKIKTHQTELEVMRQEGEAESEGDPLGGGNRAKCESVVFLDRA
jgi:hypothetical protein